MSPEQFTTPINDPAHSFRYEFLRQSVQPTLPVRPRNVEDQVDSHQINDNKLNLLLITGDDVWMNSSGGGKIFMSGRDESLRQLRDFAAPPLWYLDDAT